MSTDLERLVLRMEANMSGYDRALRKMRADTNTNARRVESRFRQTGQTIDRTFNQISRNATRALGLIGVGLSAQALTNTITQSLQLAETMVDTADRVGFTVEQLQELRFAADQNGSSARTLDMALQRFSRRTGEAAQGTGELRQTIVDLGIELRNSDGTMRTSHEVLLDYADAIQRAESDQEALRLAFKAFDSEGAQLVTLMRQGRDGIAEFAGRARDASQVMDEGLARNAAEANRALREMRMEIDGKLNTAVAENAEAIRGMGEALGAVAAAAVEAGAAFAGLFQDPRGAEAIGAEIERLETRLSRLRLRGDGRGDIAGIEARIGQLRALLAVQQAIDESPVGAAAPLLTDTEAQDVGETIGEAFVRVAEAFGPEPWTDPQPGLSAIQRGQEMYQEGIARQESEQQARDLADREAQERLNAISRRREDFAQEFAWTFASGMQAAFDGRLQDFIKQRLRDAMFNAMMDAFSNIGRRVFDRVIGSVIGGGGGIKAPFGGARAAGGPVGPGKAYRVGERGPEMFVPGRAGIIQPNPASLAAGRRGGGGTVRIVLETTEGPMFGARVSEISAPLVMEGVEISVARASAEVGADMARAQMTGLR
jgi:hypothetical protein